ncbi:hypothetical protein TrVE_jg13284 [Triparma verrucosa]|uniref:Uncharacterized protein n=1 Tax=Triparma verrucosa TaxID=1606542 RepID=A0A9W7C1Q2_9STRA|nr:hypothetical protein TrVE_jg13284 [Triparma verrucosa]
MKVIRRAFARKTHCDLKLALHVWKLRLREYRRKREGALILSEGLVLNRARAVERSFSTWRITIEEDVQREEHMNLGVRLLKDCISRLEDDKLSAAMRFWKDVVRFEKAIELRMRRGLDVIVKFYKHQSRMKVGKAWRDWMKRVAEFREESERVKNTVRVVVLKMMSVRSSLMLQSLRVWKEMVDEWNWRRGVVKRFFGMVLSKELGRAWRAWWKVVVEKRMVEGRMKNVREFDRYQAELESLKKSASKIILMVMKKNSSNRVMKYMTLWKKSVAHIKRDEEERRKILRNIILWLRGREAEELTWWFVKWRGRSDGIKEKWEASWRVADLVARRRVMTGWRQWRAEVVRVRLIKKAIMRAIVGFAGRLLRGAWSVWRKNALGSKARAIGAKIAHSVLSRVLRRATHDAWGRWTKNASTIVKHGKMRNISVKIIYSVLARLAKQTLIWAFNALRLKTVGGRKLLVSMMLGRAKDLRQWRLRKGIGRWRRYMDFVRRELLLGVELGVAKRGAAGKIARVLEGVVGGELRGSFGHWTRVLREAAIKADALVRIGKILRNTDKLKMADLWRRWRAIGSVEVRKFQACFIISKYCLRQLRESFAVLRRETDLHLHMRKKDKENPNSSDVFLENLKTIRLGHKKERKKIGARLICFLYDECSVRTALREGFGRWKTR